MTEGHDEMHIDHSGTVAVPVAVLRGVVHDLNHAITFPMATLSLVRDAVPEDDEQALEALENAEEACRYARGIVTQINSWLGLWIKQQPVKTSVRIGDLVLSAVRSGRQGRDPAGEATAGAVTKSCRVNCPDSDT